MFRILTIGDPHFMISNLDDVEIFIKRFIILVEEKNPDIIVILGDILHEHERLHISPLNKAISFIKNLSNYCPVYCLVGNHDMLNNKQFLTDNHWMNALKTASQNIIIVDKVISLDIDIGKFLFCPYVPPGQFQEALDTYGDISNTKTIFAHQEFYNCKMGAIISTEGDKWDINNPLIISGHIHSNQRPQKNIYYPGAALQHAFGESEKNIIAEIQYDEEGIYKIIEHDLKLPRKDIKYVSLEELQKFTNVNTDNKTKLTVKCNYDDFKAFKKSQKYKELSKYENIKIIHKPEKIKKIEQEKIEDGKNIELENESDFKILLYNSIITEKNQYIVSDFNYLFLNKNKDEEILVL